VKVRVIVHFGDSKNQVFEEVNGLWISEYADGTLVQFDVDEVSIYVSLGTRVVRETDRVCISEAKPAEDA
jgi:hypothetical protein